MKFESSPNNSVNITDYEGTVLYPLLAQMPTELARRYMSKIEEDGLDDSAAVSLLSEVLSKRREAVTTTVISDETVSELFEGRTAELLQEIETRVFSSFDNHLGSGMTARVKQFDLTNNTGEVTPIAVKYLTSPTEKTLSAAGEHDMTVEVERVQAIEQIERSNGVSLEHIRVPHPYFHHRTSKIQCYGMELINGITLEAGIQGEYSEELREKLRSSKLRNTPREVIFAEIEKFFTVMHKYCLHGDIKPGNMMVNDEGTFYVIDFGQSVLTNSINDKQSEPFQNLQDDEIKLSKLAVMHFLNSLFSDDVAKQAA